MKILIFLFLSSVMWCEGQTSRKLMWSDEFDYSGKPDEKKWGFDLGDGCPNCGWGNNEAQLYTNELKNSYVKNGVLTVEAIKKEGKWTSARLTTQGKFGFAHGRIEFRAKLPAGKGTWPALWMLGESVKTEGWPACGEIDIMEHVGRNPTVVQSAMHTQSNYGNTINKGDTKVIDFDKEFHIYGAEWSAEKIDFFVDDKVFYTYNPTVKDKNTWPLDSPFYVIINIAIGGNLGGHDIDPTLTSVKMLVDYVRVYN